MCRWDKDRPATVDNLVLLNFEEAEEHEGTTLDKVRESDPAFYDRVQLALGRIHHDIGAEVGNCLVSRVR